MKKVNWAIKLAALPSLILPSFLIISCSNNQAVNALTEEQIKNGVNNNPNISSNETAVENTSSFGSLMPYFIATICILLGGCFLYKTCREN